MTTSKLCRNMASNVFKTTAALFTTIGFLAAAVFLVAVLWLPADAASTSSKVDVQPTLLLDIDKPKRPAPKLRLASLAEDVKEMPDRPSPELATELNSWTFTQGNLGQQLGSYFAAQFALIERFELHALYTQVSLLLNFFRLESMILHDFGLPVPVGLTGVINQLSSVQNSLSQFR